VGLETSRGRKIRDILAAMRTIAAAVRNTQSLRLLAQRLEVEMPIVEQMSLVLYEDKKPTEAVRDLMQRSLKPEIS